MELIALAVAVLALLVALAAKRAAGQKEAVGDLRADARREAQNVAEELRAELATLRGLLAEVAAGGDLDPDQIREGRLWKDVTPSEALPLVEGHAVRLLDVRSPSETAAGIIPGALVIPIDELEERVAEIEKDGQPMLVYCAGGGRSAAACEFLSQHGYSKLSNLAGGISSWTGPVQKP